jgi:hypothetical protein
MKKVMKMMLGAALDSDCGQIETGAMRPPVRSGRVKVSQTDMAAFRKRLDEHHPADPKIEVSAVENKVCKYYRKCQNGIRLTAN